MAVGVRPGPRQNVYQLGICMLQVFTFHHPYRGLNLPQIIKMQLEGKLPPELVGLREKDAIACDLVARCLEPLETRITLAEVLKHPYLAEELPTGVEGTKSPEGVKSPDPIVKGIERSNSDSDSTAAYIALSRKPSVATSSAAAAVAAAAAASSSSSSSASLSTSAGISTALAISQSVAATKRSRVFKCYIGVKSHEAPCVRVRLDESIASLEELKRVVDEEFQDQQKLFADKLVLRYRDADGDLVMITSRTSLNDIIEYAVNLELHPHLKNPAVSNNLLGDFLK